MKMWLSDRESDDIFIAVESGTQTVRGGWPTVVVWIQCFNFGSGGDATG
jgi:hypothetical protein